MTNGIARAQGASWKRLPDALRDADLTQDQWVARFALRIAMLDDPSFSGIEPEVIADAEYRAGLRRG